MAPEIPEKAVNPALSCRFNEAGARMAPEITSEDPKAFANLLASMRPGHGWPRR